MGEFIEFTAFLVIAIAWLLRAVLTSLSKRRQRSPQKPQPVSPKSEEQPQRTAADLLRELGLDLGEPEPEMAREVIEAPSSAPAPSMPPVPLPLPPLATGRSLGRRKRGIRESLLRDLRGGPPSLRRAIVLAEVFGPPPGLRSADSKTQR